MNVYEYVKYINEKIDKIHKHPNIKKTNFSTNPFEKATNQTYVWVEKCDCPQAGCEGE